MAGPYQTETDTYSEPMPTATSELHAARRVRPGDPEHLVRDTIMRHVSDVCVEVGVDLGEFDRRKLAWLAEVDPGAVQVVIGLITRAHEAGRAVRA